MVLIVFMIGVFGTLALIQILIQVVQHLYHKDLIRMNKIHIALNYNFLNSQVIVYTQVEIHALRNNVIYF